MKLRIFPESDSKRHTLSKAVFWGIGMTGVTVGVLVIYTGIKYNSFAVALLGVLLIPIAILCGALISGILYAAVNLFRKRNSTETSDAAQGIFGKEALLRELKSQYDQGHLSETEFTNQKKRILDPVTEQEG